MSKVRGAKSGVGRAGSWSFHPRRHHVVNRRESGEDSDRDRRTMDRVCCVPNAVTSGRVWYAAI